uniref:Uncharacterized protein LOC102801727 n=1 Tax=Saccoglossus kowalevskii TaxID=10224 RepID=A0ABM0LVF7_SACKO|nr:PREDICTED: uncharacterized protein LOC102801727 [Saccoglossus kowalevskii]
MSDEHNQQLGNDMNIICSLHEFTLPETANINDGIGHPTSTSAPHCNSQSELVLNPSTAEFTPSVEQSGFQRGQTGGNNQHMLHKNESSVTDRRPNETILSVVRELKKPQSDIKCFGGDIMEYTKFMRQFKSRVVANTETDDERMNYLEQYTTGEANTIFSGFGYLDASKGYPPAIKELEDRYGNSEIIASAYIKRAMKWSSITYSNAKGQCFSQNVKMR